MNAKNRSPSAVSWGALEQRGWPPLSRILAVEEADGQPPEQEHADVLAAKPEAEATSSAPEFTIGELTYYPALADYLAAEEKAQQRKNEGYAQAVEALERDGDYAAFLQALAVASRHYRAALKEALRKLRQTIRQGGAMDEAEAETFWYRRGLEHQRDANPAA